MSDLKPLICPGCSGHIDRTTLICKSCGTAYMLDDNFKPVRIEMHRPDVITVGSVVHLPRELVIDSQNEGKTAMEMTLEEMAEDLAHKLLPMVEYQMEYDSLHFQYITYGRLRVVDPHKHWKG